MEQSRYIQTRPILINADTEIDIAALAGPNGNVLDYGFENIGTVDVELWGYKPLPATTPAGGVIFSVPGYRLRPRKDIIPLRFVPSAGIIKKVILYLTIELPAVNC
jgi:hypothetical protein